MKPYRNDAKNLRKCYNARTDPRDASIPLFGQYRADQTSTRTPVNGTASPLSPSLSRASVAPDAVCGESIIGSGSYLGEIRDLPRIVHLFDDDGKETTETINDGVLRIYTPSVSTIWTQNASLTWQTQPIAAPPTLDSYTMHDPSTYCYDEWQAVDYRAVASPGGAVAVLGGDHLFSSRRWQVWKSSATPGQGPPLWETSYNSGNSQLLIKAVNDDGIVVGERITGTDTYWGQIDSVVVKNGEETILPESSGAFTFGASLCQINENDPDSRSRLAVGGSSLWVEKENAWHLAEHPPTMAKIIAIAKNGVMLGARTIWRNGISIPLEKLVENPKISPTNSAPRYTNLRAYAMNGEGAIVALADDANAPSPMPNGKALLLLSPVEVQELSPKLRDDDDKEIKGSEKPAKAPKSTEMVERDPSATPTPLNDASAIRIAWRDMKVKIGAPLTGNKVTWSMTPQFTPLQSDGTPEAAPRFRGKWGNAANTVHLHRFSASEKYGVNGYESIAQILETETSANVTTVAQTTIDAEGYTAIRVNLPPIGFNKARIKIQIEGTEGEIDLIDLEVPAVVVIDPGHGGIGRIDRSDGNHATSDTGELEKNMTLSVAKLLREELKLQSKNQKLKSRVIFTREDDTNLGIGARAEMSSINGADDFLSIHFNGVSNKATRGTEVWIYPGSPPRAGYASNEYQNEHTFQQINYDADHRFATRIFNAAVATIGPSTRGVREWDETDEHMNGEPAGTKHAKIPAEIYYDKELGNKVIPGNSAMNKTISRAALVELEFISNAAADTWFNGSQGAANQHSLAVTLATSILTDIKDSQNP